jgi:hypothetical protein
MAVQLHQLFVGLVITDDRALGHLHNEFFCALAMSAATRTMGAVACYPVRMVPKPQQRCHVAIGFEPNVTTIAPVAAVGSTQGHVGFASRRHATGAAVSGARTQIAFVNEVRHLNKDTAFGACYSVRRTGSPMISTAQVVVSSTSPVLW